MVDYLLEKVEWELINKVSEFFICLWVKMIYLLVQYVVQQFIDNFEVVYVGIFGCVLMEDGSLLYVIVQMFKDVVMEWVFCYLEVEILELQGYCIIQGLLDFYVLLLCLLVEEFQVFVEGCQVVVLYL